MTSKIFLSIVKVSLKKREVSMHILKKKQILETLKVFCSQYKEAKMKKSPELIKKSKENMDNFIKAIDAQCKDRELLESMLSLIAMAEISKL